MECDNVVKRNRRVVFIGVTLLLFVFSLTVEAKTTGTILEDVISLKLGIAGYVIGEKLDGAKKEIAKKHPVKDAYEGTYKFVDNDLFVVVDKKTDRILALYEDKKEADKEQLKAMIADLMGHFGPPTTMAHDKILYWAFNKYGAVSEEDFNRAKKVQQTAELKIIATVKLNSEMKITPDRTTEEETATDKDPAAMERIYFIITSDPLVQEFMATGFQEK